MRNSDNSSIDALVLVPFPFLEQALIDPISRKTEGAYLIGLIARSLAKLESYVGTSLSFQGPDAKLELDGVTIARKPKHRTLTSVVLCQALEEAGISWAGLDPGDEPLSYWRDRFKEYAARNPKVIAVSTTFCLGTTKWLHTYFRLIREAFPNAKIIVGGQAYVMSAKEFLKLDADVYFLGEGEARFPEVVSAILDDGSAAFHPGGKLDEITGLYVRRPSGHLHFTLQAQPLQLDELSVSDWSLMRRIDPPVDPETHRGFRFVETQRGCFFKCQFCTYRTVMPLAAMTPERAAEHVIEAAKQGSGPMYFSDPTAAFPRKRFEALCQAIIDKGGPPIPLACFARVTDIHESTAQLMAKAGFFTVFVGQESGDQRVLNLMKKGTKAVQTKPAIKHLSNAGITAVFGFIYGFPGETEESAMRTMDMILTLNEEVQDRPVVLYYLAAPFIEGDFSGVVANRPETGVLHIYEHYKSANPEVLSEEHKQQEVSGVRAFDYLRDTIVASSKILHAPVPFEVPAVQLISAGGDVVRRKDYKRIHHWLKAIHRGMAIFIEEEAYGKKPDKVELERVRGDILRPMTLEANPIKRIQDVVKRTAMAKLFKQISFEWLDESKGSDAGLGTRAILSGIHLKLMRDPQAALSVLRTGVWPDYSLNPPGVEEAAKQLVLIETSRSKSQKNNPMHTVKPKAETAREAGKKTAVA